MSGPAPPVAIPNFDDMERMAVWLAEEAVAAFAERLRPPTIVSEAATGPTLVAHGAAAEMFVVGTRGRRAIADALSAAREFVDDFQDSLRRKPTWPFSSRRLGVAEPKDPIDPDLVERLIAATGAREHWLCSGRLEVDRLARTERFVARWVGAESEDQIEWDDVRQWAAEIVEYLRAERT